MGSGGGGRGATKQERGRHLNFYPTKRGAEMVLAMVKGGHNKVLGTCYAVA